jgi:predicted nucleic acid-binding protein
MVMAEPWLDAAVTPSASDQPGIVRIWVALNGGLRPPVLHAGEAQSIYFAEQLGGMFATDDNVAYAFAERRLGIGRVVDTVEILRAGVREGHIVPAEALRAARMIRGSGRYLRRVHPSIVTEAYFV